jgi:hypothetical protein
LVGASFVRFDEAGCVSTGQKTKRLSLGLVATTDAIDPDRLGIEHRDAGKVAAQGRDVVLEHAVIVVMVAGDEQHAPLIGVQSRPRLPDAVKGLGVLDAHIRRRIRAIIVRQKKRPRFLLRHLLSLGVGRSAAAGAAYCSRGAWNRSNRPALTRAYPPSWFIGRLVSLKARWGELNAPQASDQLSLAL